MELRFVKKEKVRVDLLVKKVYGEPSRSAMLFAYGVGILTS